MNYDVRNARKVIREIGGDLVYQGKRREYPPSGRAYWRRLYRLELPGQGTRIIDRVTAIIVANNIVLDRQPTA
jgi:hypothetical protein